MVDNETQSSLSWEHHVRFFETTGLMTFNIPGMQTWDHKERTKSFYSLERVVTGGFTGGNL